ncbi:hypothetical protein B0H10DRAFT_2320779 [Mycena sp. CBHHK59/15]|nr:hypothetical protein B0H10DRAFT_2320779 [Mycena sp. CBHHK59/15]
MNDGDPYILSPIDDIESFFWLALWAVLINIYQSTHSKHEIGWQKDLDSAQQKLKSSILENVMNTILDDCSPISQELLPLLISWWECQRDLRKKWNTEITQAASGDAFERLISRTIFWVYCIVTPPATIAYIVIGLNSWAYSQWMYDKRFNTIQGAISTAAEEIN